MRRLIGAILLLILLVPATTQGLPGEPEPTPKNGCVFADAVLKEIADEETRLYIELERSSQAKKVVLMVQIRSGENLRRVTHSWKDDHCVKIIPH